MRPSLRNVILNPPSSGLSNYVLNPGYTFQNFADYASWTVGSGTKAIGVSGGIDVVPSAVSTTATLDKVLTNLDLSTVTSVTLEYLCSDRLNVAEINVLLSTSASSGSINGARIMFQTLQADVVNGFNRATIHKDYGTANGGVTWADVFKYLRIQVKSSAAGVPTVTLRNLTFNQQNKAIAIVQFDDFADTFYNTFYGVFNGKTQANGLAPKGSLAAQTSTIGNAGNMTGGQLQTLVGAGWDIATHAHNHVSYATLTAGQIQTDIASQRAALQALNIADSHCHAYTNGAYDATIISTLNGLGITFGRSSDDGLQSHENRNYMNLRTTSKSSATSVANLQLRIDQCVKNGRLYFTYSHNDYQSSKLGQELDYLIANNVEIMTMQQYTTGLTMGAQPSQ